MRGKGGVWGITSSFKWQGLPVSLELELRRIWLGDGLAEVWLPALSGQGSRVGRMGVPPLWFGKQGCSLRVKSQARVSEAGSTQAPVSGI